MNDEWTTSMDQWTRLRQGYGGQANGPADQWTNGPMDECLLDDLRGLPFREPAVAHSARVRQRCHKVLARRSKVVARPLESALVGGFCAVYFAGVALMALRTHGIL